MYKIDISIIMPLYNADRYLECALDCILNQSKKEFELICIDDGSTDKTVDIVKERIKNDSRIVLLENEKNMGAAYSRNKGMSCAQGKYFSFLDGDDVFDVDMLLIAYNHAIKYDAQLVVFEYKHVPTEDASIINVIQTNYSREYIDKYCKNTFKLVDVDERVYSTWSNGPCNKLYRRDLIEENNICFQSLQSCNDVYFVEMCFSLSDSIIFVDSEKILLKARDHDAPSRISNNRKTINVYKSFEKLIFELQLRNACDNIMRRVYEKTYWSFVSLLNNKKKSYEEREWFYYYLQKEGIVIFDNAEKCNVSDTVLNGIKKIKEQSFETEWYKYNTLISHLFDINKVRYECASRTVIWGCGIRGKRIIQFLYNNGLSVKAVCDINPNIAGNLIGHYIVNLVDEIDWEDVDTVVVSALGIVNDVKEYLKDFKNIRIIELDKLFIV